MKQSKFLSLGWRDLARAFLTALIALVLEFLQNIFIPSLNVSPEIKTFLVMGIAYLSKNFFTKPDKPNAFSSTGEDEAPPEPEIGGGGIKNDPPKK